MYVLCLYNNYIHIIFTNCLVLKSLADVSVLQYFPENTCNGSALC